MDCPQTRCTVGLDGGERDADGFESGTSLWQTQSETVWEPKRVRVGRRLGLDLVRLGCRESAPVSANQFHLNLGSLHRSSVSLNLTFSSSRN